MSLWRYRRHPFDTGAYASSGTYFSGNAALQAANNLKQDIVARAALYLNTSPEQLCLCWPGGVAWCKEPEVMEVSFATLAHAAEQGHGSTALGPLSAKACFTTDKHAIPYAAHFCQVAVTTRTGQIKVLRYHALHDSGIPINPEIAQAQIYGGVLKSLGHSLWEELVLDAKGSCCNADLENYGVPSILDAPQEFTATLIPTHDPNGPFGAKSISEVATNGAAPAIANAIHDACGIWIRTWPFTAEKVLRGLGKIKDGKRKYL